MLKNECKVAACYKEISAAVLSSLYRKFHNHTSMRYCVVLLRIFTRYIIGNIKSVLGGVRNGVGERCSHCVMVASCYVYVSLTAVKQIKCFVYAANFARAGTPSRHEVVVHSGTKRRTLKDAHALNLCDEYTIASFH